MRGAEQRVGERGQGRRARVPGGPAGEGPERPAVLERVADVPRRPHREREEGGEPEHRPGERAPSPRPDDSERDDPQPERRRRGLRAHREADGHERGTEQGGMGVCAGGESQTTEDRRESRQVGAGRVGRELRGDEREGEERRGRCDRCPARRAEPARGGAEGQGGEAHQRGREEGDRCERARERQQPGQSDLRGERVVAHREVPLHQVDGARPTRAHPSERLGKVVGQRVEAQPRSLEQDDRRRGHRTAERAPREHIGSAPSYPPPGHGREGGPSSGDPHPRRDPRQRSRPGERGGRPTQPREPERQLLGDGEGGPDDCARQQTLHPAVRRHPRDAPGGERERADGGHDEGRVHERGAPHLRPRRPRARSRGPRGRSTSPRPCRYPCTPRSPRVGRP